MSFLLGDSHIYHLLCDMVDMMSLENYLENSIRFGISYVQMTWFEMKRG